ncbi:MAG: hypothetical protein RIC55_25410 [Pirellulaceae bacterium]
MDVALTVDPDVRDLAVGVVIVSGACIAPSNAELRAHCDEAARRAAAEGADGGDSRRAAVRQLLRHGGFKPAGRGKPAQEYLLRVATEQGELPSINNVVDVINSVSLSSGLPISLLSLDRVGSRILVRYGKPEEQYVFNSSGQTLDVRGLLCLCARDGASSQPVGSPVKDSMAGKVEAADRNLLACLYAPHGEVSIDQLRDYGRQLSNGFSQWCGAERCELRVLSPDANKSTTR